MDFIAGTGFLLLCIISSFHFWHSQRDGGCFLPPITVIFRRASNAMSQSDAIQAAIGLVLLASAISTKLDSIKAAKILKATHELVNALNQEDKRVLAVQTRKTADATGKEGDAEIADQAAIAYENKKAAQDSVDKQK
jgi:hypothetical protein